MGIIERVETLVTPLCDRVGVELFDLEYEGGVVRLVIDHPDGVGMGAIAQLTREVSRAFDHEEPINGTYTLEVTSPGLERSLKKPDHFARAMGETVTIKTQPGVEGDRRFGGVLESSDDNSATIRLEDGATRTVAFSEILKARTVFDWAPEPKGPRRNDERPASTGVGSSTESDVKQ
ncbi:MAG TPA: ribosome maturation factor RimP [Acidimicrobiia bacterium]|jgi:ribosome maturation factor RimP|nr:ribosome maturation factor RimP [Acidimicrobiia bacterium]HIL46436.1 ribosome maturation factor RimP [Acidimicrobiia bacterium]